nr:hypothetical protein [Desulfosporosinus youngiae]
MYQFVGGGGSLEAAGAKVDVISCRIGVGDHGVSLCGGTGVGMKTNRRKISAQFISHGRFNIVRSGSVNIGGKPFRLVFINFNIIID